jgi:hypothetical protein
MTTYTAWYLAIASIIHGQAEGVKHSGPTKLVLYTVVSQLPNLVIPWPWNDHLHRLVLSHCLHHPRPGNVLIYFTKNIFHHIIKITTLSFSYLYALH